jgi:hypothetical protein
MPYPKTRWAPSRIEERQGVPREGPAAIFVISLAVTTESSCLLFRASQVTDSVLDICGSTVHRVGQLLHLPAVILAARGALDAKAAMDRVKKSRAPPLAPKIEAGSAMPVRA